MCIVYTCTLRELRFCDLFGLPGGHILIAYCTRVDPPECTTRHGTICTDRTVCTICTKYTL